jgi:putative methyltransferase (TIGR04325 family)
MNLKFHLKSWLPPIVLGRLQTLRKQWKNKRSSSAQLPEWEYCPDGWDSKSDNIGGWNQVGVADAYAGKWRRFIKLISGTKPLGVNHEFINPGNNCFDTHNQVMTLAYVVGHSALGRNHLKILDFGGALGHHFLFLQALFPKVSIEYSCNEVSLVCEMGQKLNPGVRFFSGDTWQAHRFDLVIASNSLQYIRAWQSELSDLAAAASSNVFLTKVPIAKKSPSFVVLQRPWKYGYRTEYKGWCFNEKEFLTVAQVQGLKLKREFLVFANDPIVPKAPENPHYKGFLFDKNDSPNDSDS